MPDRKRVQVYQLRSGHWRFRYQKREGSTWRTVDTRGEGTTWTQREALDRARIYGESMGARVRLAEL
jgi:hypothetical protein